MYKNNTDEKLYDVISVYNYIDIKLYSIKDYNI